MNGGVRSRVVAVVAGSPRLSSLARSAARRWAGSHYVAAIAIVVDDSNRVLVARHRFRHDVLALPGGWVHRRETPMEAVEREVREETGLIVRAVELVAHERHGSPQPTRYPGITLAFRCDLCGGSGDELESQSIEVTELQWIDRDELDSSLTAFEREAIAAAVNARRSPT